MLETVYSVLQEEFKRYFDAQSVNNAIVGISGGIDSAIVGISGGIDSAVVAKLCVDVLGADNVIGISMPCGIQSDVKDAIAVIDHLHIKHHTLNIEPMLNAYIESYSIANPKDKREIIQWTMRKGNLAARLRMCTLYDFSKVYNGLVIGTGNKTELMLGYFTLHGDGACAIEPIGNIYKTEVKALAEYLQLPKRIIDKAPSAGLWKNQTDEDELGFTYEEIDRLLIAIEEHEKNTPNKNILKSLKSSGFKINIISHITSLIQNNAFKNKHPKPLLG